MRLDHLLSKEHHPVKAGMEPTTPACGVGVLKGGDTGENDTGNGRLSEYTAVRRTESSESGAAGRL